MLHALKINKQTMGCDIQLADGEMSGGICPEVNCCPAWVKCLEEFLETDRMFNMQLSGGISVGTHIHSF